MIVLNMAFVNRHSLPVNSLERPGANNLIKWNHKHSSIQSFHSDWGSFQTFLQFQGVSVNQVVSSPFELGKELSLTSFLRVDQFVRDYQICGWAESLFVSLSFENQDVLVSEASLDVNFL